MFRRFFFSEWIRGPVLHNRPAIRSENSDAIFSPELPLQWGDPFSSDSDRMPSLRMIDFPPCAEKEGADDDEEDSNEVGDQVRLDEDRDAEEQTQKAAREE